MGGTMSGILAALLISEVIWAVWFIRRDWDVIATKMTLISGMLVGLIVASLGMSAIVYLQTGTAGEAVGWSRHTEKVVGSMTTQVPTIITLKHTVQVGEGTWFNGQIIDYSCPPNWQQKLAPACKQNDILEICAKGCALHFWKLAVPMAILSFVIGSLPYIVLRSRERRRH